MFWNKKDDKGGLPDLPPLKTPLHASFNLPKKVDMLDANNPVEEEHSLPTFPDSPMQKPFSQSVIKEAISQPIPEESMKSEEINNEELLPSSSSSRMKTMEMDSPPVRSMSQKPFTLDSPPEENAYIPPRKPMQKTSEIFVKLERFNSAHRSILGIRKKIDEIDSALKRIREIKMREEQELSAWEKEISSLKSRLQEVNDTLFD